MTAFGADCRRCWGSCPTARVYVWSALLLLAEAAVASANPPHGAYSIDRFNLARLTSDDSKWAVPQCKPSALTLVAHLKGKKIEYGAVLKVSGITWTIDEENETMVVAHHPEPPHKTSISLWFWKEPNNSARGTILVTRLDNKGNPECRSVTGFSGSYIVVP